MGGYNPTRLDSTPYRLACPTSWVDDRPTASLRCGTMAQWRCRVCGFGRYHRVAVLKKNGQRYETAFFACSGCSVMFLNDVTFNDLHTITADVDMVAVVTPIRRRR